MQLQDYFDFLAPNDIRIRGSRVGIETVLADYIDRGRRPEQIQKSYPTLSLEEVYATILYYLHNRPAVEQYLAEYHEYCRAAREEQNRNPSPAVLRFRKLAAALDAAKRVSAECHDDPVSAR